MILNETCARPACLAKSWDHPIGESRRESVGAGTPQPTSTDGRADLFDSFKRQLPWLIAGLALLGAILRDILKDWLKSAVKYLGNLVYNRAAASRLLRRVATRRYRAAVAKRFQNLKILFRPNEPLDMAKIYVPLEFAADTPGQNIGEAFEITQGIDRGDRIVILGSPGAGKSMLLRHLALRYASQDVSTEQTRFPVYLELHRLAGTDPDVDTLLKHLIAQFARDEFPNAARFVRQSLRSGTLLILLDGLDEVSSAERGQVAQAINDFMDTFERCPVVLTCRTAAFRDAYLYEEARVLAVSDFEDHLIRQFLHQWPGVADSSAAEDLMRILQETPRMLALARNPLLLTMLAYLYTDVYGGSSRLLPKSRADFYRDATDVLLRRWHEEANRFNPNAKREVLRHLALTGLDSARESSDRLTLDYRTVREKITELLPDLGLGPSDVDPLLREIVERSGLLLEIDGGESYQFGHLTLQEYFAAMELGTHMEELYSRYSRDPDVWREAVRLWCGSVGDCTALAARLFITDAVLALECVVDAARIDHGVASRIVNGICQSPENLMNERSARALAALASDLAPRGEELFARLDAMMHGDGSLRLAAANVLCKTNRREACRLLVEDTDRHHDYWPLIAQMGDVAVRDVARVAAMRSNELAVDCLAQIATPDAAAELARLLWGPEPLAWAAAWRLAGIFDRPFIHDGLDELNLPDAYAPLMSWVWEPFVSSGRSSAKVGIVAGRIVQLIEQTGIAPSTVAKHIDPRLAIPLLLLTDQRELRFLSSYKMESSVPSLHELTPDRLASSVASYSVRRALSDQEPRLNGTDLGQLIMDSLANTDRAAAVDAVVDEVLSQTSQSPVGFHILQGMTGQQRANIVGRGLQSVTRQHWEDLLRQDRYDIDRGWQFHCLQIITFCFIAASVSAGVDLLSSTHSVLKWFLIIAIASTTICIVPLYLYRQDFFMTWSQAFLSPVLGVAIVSEWPGPDPEELLSASAVAATPSMVWLCSWWLVANTGINGWFVAGLWIPVIVLITKLITSAERRAARLRNPLIGVVEG
ncbi:NACHT domain-containing protein [Kribbella soli]